MSDDKTKSGGQDRERINVNGDDEVRDWARSLNTTPGRLKEAVQAVGDLAEKVREFLPNKWPSRWAALDHALEHHHVHLVAHGDVAVGVMQHDQAVGLDHRAEHA